MMANKTEKLVWLIFTVIGAIFLIVGMIICLPMLNRENKIETTGVITGISTYRYGKGNSTYHILVSYKVNGEEYESNLKGYSSDFYEGKEIEIYYDKNNPAQIGSNTLDLIMLIFPGIGLVFILVGGIGIGRKINRKRITKKLKENGEKIYATYIETRINRAYSVNKRYPYNIICEWNNLEDNQKYLLKSENIWIDPENIIEEKQIKTFPVYRNPKKRKQYYVDITEVTKDVIDLT